MGNKYINNHLTILIYQKPLQQEGEVVDLETEKFNYYLPNLVTPNGNYKIGKYGRARRQYLKEYKKSKYSALMISGNLHKHLHDVDIKAQKIMDCFIKDAEKTAPDKATNQMEWVGHMNNARNSAEEVINYRLIYI